MIFISPLGNSCGRKKRERGVSIGFDERSFGTKKEMGALAFVIWNFSIKLCWANKGGKFLEMRIHWLLEF